METFYTIFVIFTAIFIVHSIISLVMIKQGFKKLEKENMETNLDEKSKKELEAYWINRLSTNTEYPIHRMVMLQVSDYACLMVDDSTLRFWIMDYYGHFKSCKNMLSACKFYIKIKNEIAEIEGKFNDE